MDYLNTSFKAYNLINSVARLLGLSCKRSNQSCETVVDSNALAANRTAYRIQDGSTQR